MSESFQDYLMDQQLHIETTGRDDSHTDDHHHAYEATDYSVLDRIVESGFIQSEDVAADYGCGKGRVLIYLNHEIGCKGLGIEYDEQFAEAFCENIKKAGKEAEIQALHADAETFELPTEVNTVFFFNPFSIEIFRSVFARIVDSYYREPREILLLFYYPSDEYIAFLMTQDLVEFYDEIDCRDLFTEKDERNKVLVFSMG